MKLHQKLPTIARILCWNYDGIIVGSSIPYLLGETKQEPKDIDIIINPWFYREVCLAIRGYNPTPEINSFGGFKLTTETFTLDVWPDTLDRLVKAAAIIRAIFPKNNIEVNIK